MGKGAHLDVRLDLRAEFLEVLDDGRVDGAAEVGVLVGDDARLVPNTIEHVLNQPLLDTTHPPRITQKTYLQAALAQELVSRPERHLDDSAQLRQLLRRVVLDIRHAL